MEPQRASQRPALDQGNREHNKTWEPIHRSGRSRSWCRLGAVSVFGAVLVAASRRCLPRSAAARAQPTDLLHRPRDLVMSRSSVRGRAKLGERYAREAGSANRIVGSTLLLVRAALARPPQRASDAVAGRSSVRGRAKLGERYAREPGSANRIVGSTPSFSARTRWRILRRCRRLALSSGGRAGWRA